MRNLVDELEWFVVFEDDLLFLFLLLLFFVSLFVALTFVHFVFRILGMLTQFDKKFCFIFKKLKQFEVMLLCVKGNSVGSNLSSFIYLFYQLINGLAGLNCHILIFFLKIVVEFVEEIRIVFWRNQISLEHFKDEDFFLRVMLTFVERGEEEANNFFLEAEHFLRSCSRNVLCILDFFKVFLELSDGRGTDGWT